MASHTSTDQARATQPAYTDPDYPLTEVPVSARRGLFSLTVVFLGFTFLTPTMLAGAQIGAAFQLQDFLLLIVSGSLILGFYVASLAIVGAIAFGEPDFVEVLIHLNLVFWAVVLLILNLWTTNDNAAYAFGVAGAELFEHNHKAPFVIGGVGIGITLALTGIYDVLPQYLIILGVMIPPLGGVILGDYIFTWKTVIPTLATVKFRTIRWSCLCAYILGTAVAGYGYYAGIGIPPIQGILVAALSVPVLNWLFSKFDRNDLHSLRDLD